MSAGLCATCGAPYDSPPPRCPQCDGAPLLDGRYRLVEVLGHGASATVYRARRVEDDREVAVRELLFVGRAEPDAFRDAMRAFTEIRSEGIPRVLEHLEHDGVDYVVQELVEGETLAAEAAHRRYNEAEVFTVLADLLDVLADLHEQTPPLVHRDVKPQNVVRRPDGRLALVDLGSVAVARDAPADARFTATGTVGYIPTEQIAGEVRPASDRYAAGALAVALLTRAHPSELMNDALELEWEPRVHLSEPRRRLLRELLHPDPDARPSDTRAAAARARALIDDASAPRRRSGAAFLALGAAALAAVALGAVALGAGLSGDGHDPPRVEKTPPPRATPEPPPPTAPVPAPPTPSRGSAEWRCEPGEGPGQHHLQIVVPARPCTPGEACERIASGVEGLDLERRCDVPDEAPGPGIVTRRVERFEHELFGEAVECNLQQIGALGCHVTCRYPDAETHEALTAHHARVLAAVRDRFGSETSANVQGPLSVPRSGSQWRSGPYELDVELDRNLCCEPSQPGCYAELRVRYARLGPPPPR